MDSERFWPISQISPCIMCVQYIGGCSVHWGMFSTLGDVQYIGGCSVHWGVFSTLGGVQYIGGYHDACGGYHDTCGRYHKYIGGCSIYWGIPLVHRRDIMVTSGGYHDACGDTISTSVDVRYIGGFH